MRRAAVVQGAIRLGLLGVLWLVIRLAELTARS